MNIYSNQKPISKAIREYESRQEYLGVFDESYRGKEWARFIRDGKYVWVRKVDFHPDDPRLDDEMYFEGKEWEAFLDRNMNR